MSIKEIDCLSKKKKPHHYGHRKRVKDKLMQSSSEQMNDRELLEMILFLVNKRQDVKPIAHEMLDHFGSLKNLILNDGISHINEIKKYNSKLPIIIKLLQEVILNTLNSKLQNKIILNVWSEMIDYLRVKFGHSKQEKFTVLFLDVSYKLIKTVIISEGTIDESAVYAREIIRKALDFGSTSIILVHNHFSGDVEPSMEDLEITRHLVKSCIAMNINIIDHVIISSDSYYSFKENGIL